MVVGTREDSDYEISLYDIILWCSGSSLVATTYSLQTFDCESQQVEYRKEVVMFDHLQSHNRIIRLATDDDLLAVKYLDDLAFGYNKGVSLDELRQITTCGAVILLYDDTVRLIGESQVLFTQVDFLPYEIKEDEAFYYGTARHPDMKKQGLGMILADAQDYFARTSGKKRASLTVRVENLPSLKLRLRSGFQICNYLSNFYPGEAGTGSRLLLTRILMGVERQIFTDVIEVPVSFADERIELSVHDRIKSLLSVGYVGFAVDDSNLYWGLPKKPSGLYRPEGSK
jgi:ribosomal protein S18 acetylase RimI-like enzyme